MRRASAGVQDAAESLLYANARGQAKKIDGITAVQRQFCNLAILDDCSDALLAVSRIAADASTRTVSRVSPTSSAKSRRAT